MIEIQKEGRTGIFDTRRGAGVVSVGRDIGIVGIFVGNGKYAKTKSAKREKKKEDEERQVLELSGTIIIGDLEIFGIVRIRSRVRSDIRCL